MTREDVLQKFGSAWRTSATDAMADYIVELLRTLADLQNDLDKMETEKDILNEDFLDMKDYLHTVVKDNDHLLTELKALRLSPLTYDGENNDEVDAYTAGYNAALEDMRDIIHKYFSKEK